MLDAGQLRHFIAVMDERHFGRAAEAVGVSQQAVSAAIARLEERLSVQLFERGPHGAAPTGYALALERHARLIVNESRVAEAEVKAMRVGGRGHVRLGVGQSFAGRIVPNAIARFRRLRPDHSLVCEVDATAVLYPALVRGEFDLVVSAPPDGLAPPPDVERETLLLERDAVLVRAEHPLAPTPDCGLEALSHSAWLAAVATAGGGWERICATFAACGVEPPRTVVRTDSVAFGDALLLADDFVAVMSREAHDGELRAGRLVEMRAPQLIHPRVAYLAWPARAPPNPGVATMIRAIREAATQTSQQNVVPPRS
jgi:DNA-binding transcriptional LysR family regulator